LKWRADEITVKTKFINHPKGEPVVLFTNLIMDNTTPKMLLEKVKAENPESLPIKPFSVQAGKIHYKESRIQEFFILL